MIFKYVFVINFLNEILLIINVTLQITFILFLIIVYFSVFYLLKLMGCT